MPALWRASGSKFARKIVDGRDKPGRDSVISG
jgi:hypothetical protein